VGCDLPNISVKCLFFSSSERLSKHIFLAINRFGMNNMKYLGQAGHIDYFRRNGPHIFAPLFYTEILIIFMEEIQGRLLVIKT
jgi:hypothetical protein